MKLLVAIPAARQHANYFSASVQQLIAFLHDNSISYAIDNLFGSSLLPAARQQALEVAIEQGFTHVLALDDDMSFTMGAVVSLLSRNLPFVGANYISKAYGHRPLTPQVQDFDGKPVSSIGKTGVEKVRDIGMGFTLIDAGIFKDIPKPWYEVPYVTEKKGMADIKQQEGRFLGEDYYVCRLLEHHGIPVHVDHDATRGVGHIGDYIFTESWAAQQRAYDRLYEQVALLMIENADWWEDKDLPPNYSNIRDELDEIERIRQWMESEKQKK